MSARWLFAAGILDGFAALLHLACIVGGAAWYRFMGAGERMARLVQAGSPQPVLITFGIAAILSAWSAYAFSGAGVIPQLPFLRTALVAICGIYALRAAALPLMLCHMRDRGTTFLYASSCVVLVFAVVHGIGIWLNWESLTR